MDVQINALERLAAQIEAEHQAAYGAARTAVEHAAHCGRLLIEAKAAVGHGGWLPWLEANTSVGARQCQKYMRLAKGWAEIEGKYEADSHLTLTEAVALLGEPKDEIEGGATTLPAGSFLAAEEQRLKRELAELKALSAQLDASSGSEGIELAGYVIERAKRLEVDAFEFRHRCTRKLGELLRTYPELAAAADDIPF